MLTLYRRHLEHCPNRKKGRAHRHCKCPLHVAGSLRGERIRKTLDLTSWEAAQDRIRDWELGVVHEDAVTIADAKRRFLEDAEARKLSRESVKKYRGLLGGRPSNKDKWFWWDGWSLVGNASVWGNCARLGVRFGSPYLTAPRANHSTYADYKCRHD